MTKRGDIGDAQAAASEWFVKLQSDSASEADWLAFEAWYGAASDNALAYEAVEALWIDIETYAPQIARRAPPTVVSLADRPASRRQAVSRQLLIAAAAAAALTIVVGGAAFRFWNGGPAQIYSTPAGQTRTVALADGTRIDLNGGSRIAVRLERHARRVEFADAQAVFDVAKDPARPFLIAIGDREVRVVGTRFDLLQHAGWMRLTVQRGVVEVRPLSSGDAEPTRIAQGQQMEHQLGQDASPVRRVDPEGFLAWQSGRLVYRDERLDRVAADLSRAFRKPMTVRGPAAALRFSGVLQLDNQDAVVGRLQALAPIVAEKHKDQIVLTARAASPDPGAKPGV